MAIKLRKNGSNKNQKIEAMKPKKIIVISCKNDDNEAKRSSFYKKLIMLKTVY